MLFLQQLADITQCKVVIPKEENAVLLGSAIIAAVAAGGMFNNPTEQASTAMKAFRYNSSEARCSSPCY